MALEELKGLIPDYAKDLKLNLSSLARETLLNEQQLYGTMLACALASSNKTVIRHVQQEVAGKLSDEAQNAAKAAASLMAMNNIYYRFVHLASHADYKTMPAKLRMNVINNPGIDKLDFELFSLAVSAINGCGMCIDSHDKVLRKGGLSAEAVQAAVRIASVLHAVARTLDGEEALA
ncbi:alkyl hydroperoxide reductase AhpD [Iodidimonas gelatinilytica]|uniref:Alkyl hydroperoxide reductase AhpD n=1 Tax=Iodidimonas gelatinilytica TaxID=1236966 RepID=A0A5A7MSW6_9PROT|nr:carboxymuconolactone decarboxylase family protein [Iodidimonas gelatinilytica]GEQ97969.1 alkyl hydroperoxide reductase AhpD [Iodidimonas gelatinilytica]GEQ99911.1 alkyl hydroperoxide reductase AhpD [Iodidimonas gelatinilytica]